MHSLVPLAVVLGAFSKAVGATSSFSQPPAAGPANNYRDNPTYEVGENIDIQWTSDLDNMDLTLWQQYPMASDTDSFYVDLFKNQRSTSFIWTVNFGGFSQEVAEGEDAIFFLAVYLAGSTAYDTSSHYFNVTIPKDATSTTSAAASETTAQAGGEPTQDPTAVTVTVVPTSTSDSDSDKNKGDNKDNDKDGGLSTGATAGIAVGASLGGLIILGGLGFLAWRHFRKRPGDGSGEYNATSQVPPGEYGAKGPLSPNQGYNNVGGVVPVQEYYKPQETPGTSATPMSVASELPASQYTHAQHPHTNVNGPGGLYEAP